MENVKWVPPLSMIDPTTCQTSDYCCTIEPHCAVMSDLDFLEGNVLFNNVDFLDAGYSKCPSLWVVKNKTLICYVP